MSSHPAQPAKEPVHDSDSTKSTRQWKKKSNIRNQISIIIEPSAYRKRTGTRRALDRDSHWAAETLMLPEGARLSGTLWRKLQVCHLLERMTADIQTRIQTHTQTHGHTDAQTHTCANAH